MTRMPVLAVALAIVLSGPVWADDSKGDDGAAKERKICKTETVTGSLVAKRRTCLTAKQWQELATRTQQNIDEYTGQRGSFPTQGSNRGNQYAGNPTLTPQPGTDY